MTVEVLNETAVRVDDSELMALAEYVMARLGMARDAELSVAFVDPDDMALLHQEWLDEPGPTDVMSFPMDELRPADPGGPPVTGVLGDVVLCYEIARQQASAAGHSTEHELRILLTHGILHLLGYDHAEPEDEARMFGLQTALVADFEAGPGRGHV
jgi:probable rRNA maturation factor